MRVRENKNQREKRRCRLDCAHVVVHKNQGTLEHCCGGTGTDSLVVVFVELEPTKRLLLLLLGASDERRHQALVPRASRGKRSRCVPPNVPGCSRVFDRLARVCDSWNVHHATRHKRRVASAGGLTQTRSYSRAQLAGLHVSVRQRNVANTPWSPP